ncbi:MAG: hypothetical protein AB7J97_06460 [Steroidobacteraceae bacterium]
MNVLIAGLRQVAVMEFNVRRKRIVVMRGWMILVCVNLGPRDARDDNQGREYDRETAPGPGFATKHAESLPQVRRWA